jgi:HEAT repeat protein
VDDAGKTASRKKKHFSEEMIHDCLQIIDSGDVEELFEIIPRIGVLCDSRFHKPLLELLNSKDIKRREFAAYSMGAMADRNFLEPLKKAFMEAKLLKGFGSNELQIAIIEAIGAIGDDASVDFFLPTLKSCCATKASAERKHLGKSSARMAKWIMESLGAIAQQGGTQSLSALVELTDHPDPEIKSQALSEISVAYWHRPNEIDDATLEKIFSLTTHPESIVAESALAALQNLADVGCKRAETYFTSSQEYDNA